jgi:molybdopterin-guanine dinucleotide biosynthesis protein A
MGRDKASMLLNDSTFLDRVAETARPLFDAVIAVERNDGPERSIATIRERQHDSHGPLFGIQRALEHAAGSPAWILATDYAALDRALLRFLLARFEETLPPLLVPQTGDELHVLCAGYRDDMLLRVDRRISNGDFRIKTLIGEAGGVIVTERELSAAGDVSSLVNINSPEDLESLRSLHV